MMPTLSQTEKFPDRHLELSGEKVSFPVTFHSILFGSSQDATREEALEAPPFFADLNLDQIVDAITARREEYNLKPFFFMPLNDIAAIKYRQEVAQDLGKDRVWDAIKSFAAKMGAVRRYLTGIDRLYYQYHKEGWFLEAAHIYCEAVTGLVRDLKSAEPQSRGILSFCEYIANYVHSSEFTSLVAETKKLKADLAAIQYGVLIRAGSVTVRKYDSEVDYSVDVERTFDKFKQGAVKDYTVKLPMSSRMSHVEAQILDFVAKLFPDIFRNLDDYWAKHANFLDETIAAFDREVQFYVAYLEYISKLKHAGLEFCYPQMLTVDKAVYDYDGFDLALAHALITEGSSVVSNDFYLEGKERIIVVSGPNQGGKTTFARTFGQLHYLAALGLPVPGRKAQLFLFDKIFTHFEREEDIENQRGKLYDDLFRIHEILNQATPNSVIIMNEMLASTTVKDGVLLGREILNKIMELDALCVCVTFIDELASLGDKTVSMVSTVVPDNPAVRTYKIVRRPADGLAYALSIAEKYRVTYDYLKRRIQ